jgi:hypothetical protein
MDITFVCALGSQSNLRQTPAYAYRRDFVWRKNNYRSTPREATKRLIRHYVLRGHSEERLRLSHMGSWNHEFRASIGGTIFHTLPDDGSLETVRSFKTTHIGVSSVNGVECAEIFPLKEIYEEIRHENDPTVPVQGRLF